MIGCSTTIEIPFAFYSVDVESLLEGEFARDIGWFKPFVYLHSAINQPGGKGHYLCSLGCGLHGSYSIGGSSNMGFLVCFVWFV